jgi:hypothetical protein
LRVAALSFAEQKAPAVVAETPAWKGTAKKVTACFAAVAAIAGAVVSFALAPLVVSLIALAATAAITALALRTLRKESTAPLLTPKEPGASTPQSKPIAKSAALLLPPRLNNKTSYRVYLQKDDGEEGSRIIFGSDQVSVLSSNWSKPWTPCRVLPGEEVTLSEVHNVSNVVQIAFGNTKLYIDLDHSKCENYLSAFNVPPHQLTHEDVVRKYADLATTLPLSERPTHFAYTKYALYAYLGGSGGSYVSTKMMYKTDKQNNFEVEEAETTCNCIDPDGVFGSAGEPLIVKYKSENTHQIWLANQFSGSIAATTVDPCEVREYLEKQPKVMQAAFEETNVLPKVVVPIVLGFCDVSFTAADFVGPIELDPKLVLRGIINQTTLPIAIENRGVDGVALKINNRYVKWAPDQEVNGNDIRDRRFNIEDLAMKKFKWSPKWPNVLEATDDSSAFYFNVSKVQPRDCYYGEDWMPHGKTRDEVMGAYADLFLSNPDTTFVKAGYNDWVIYAKWEGGRCFIMRAGLGWQKRWEVVNAALHGESSMLIAELDKPGRGFTIKTSSDQIMTLWPKLDQSFGELTEIPISEITAFKLQRETALALEKSKSPNGTKKG